MQLQHTTQLLIYADPLPFVADVQGPQKVQGGARRQQDLGGRLLPSAHREPGHRRVRSLGLVEEETAAEGMFTSFFI